jgi:putative N6-adenine-specific DNA methylase
LTRKWYAFQGWPDFDRPLWNAIRDDARRAVRKELPTPIAGSDVRQDAIDFARGNARTAGVGHLLTFEKLELRDARPPSDVPGMLICNPPYGERLGAAVKPGFAGDRSRGTNGAAVKPGFAGDRSRGPEEEEELIGLYARIGQTATAHWRGWRLLVFTSNTMLAKKVGLKVVHKEPFFNGSLECFLWEFRV